MVLVKNKPKRFGLYGEDDQLLPDFIHCETIEYRSRKHNWVIAPHVHANLFQIFFIYSGKLEFIFDSGHEAITGPAIITVPENTLHGFNVGKNIKGIVLTISSSFIETLFSTLPGILSELNALRILKEFKNPRAFEATKHMVDGLLDEIHEEFPGKSSVLLSYLHLLLSKIYRLAIDRNETTFQINQRNAGYLRAFRRSVKQSSTPMKSIRDYAVELNITPVHLNRICQSSIGKSALQVVHDFLFLEAKKYILHTDYSISEIAYRLNFEDPAYFSRFFKKMAGTSPKLFRSTALSLKFPAIGTSKVADKSLKL
jgi:AraC family transcriptional activator of pobA